MSCKRFFAVVLLLMAWLIVQSLRQSNQTGSLYPIFDPEERGMPRRFRIAQDADESIVALDIQRALPLRASGSGQFSEKSFIEMVRRLSITPDQLIVLDLREESHGFINGIPVSWTDGKYNYGNLYKTRGEIEADEHQRLHLAAQVKEIVVNPIKNPIKCEVDSAQTERVLVEEAGAAYVRLPITDRNRPSDAIVEQFIALIQAIPPDKWVHFHCKAGKGRTTVCLTMLDMMKNAGELCLNDILDRQRSIGGSHLAKFDYKTGEQKRAAQERMEFLQQFYRYCVDVPDFSINWSDWLRQEAPAHLEPVACSLQVAFDGTEDGRCKKSKLLP